MRNALMTVVATLVMAGCANMPNIPGGGGGDKTTAFISGALNLGQALRPIPEDEEIEIGSGISETLLGASPLLRDSRKQKYVNEVGRWVASQSDRPDLPWKFGIIDNENINAFATPGGTIFITNGLLKRLNSESELAAVLAHEVAHVIQRHHLIAFRKGAFGSFIGNVADYKTAGKQSAGAANALVSGTKELYSKGLSRDDELEADRMGVVLATRAGYDPYGLVSVLQMLQAAKNDDPLLGLLTKTHPGPADRLAELERVINALGAYEKQDQGRQRFQMAMGRASETVYTPVPQPSAPETTTSTKKPAPARKPATKKPG